MNNGRRQARQATLQTEQRQASRLDRVEPFLAHKAWFSIPRFAWAQGGSQEGCIVTFQVSSTQNHKLEQGERKNQCCKILFPLLRVCIACFLSLFVVVVAVTLHRDVVALSALIQILSRSSEHNKEVSFCAGLRQTLFFYLALAPKLLTCGGQAES